MGRMYEDVYRVTFFVNVGEYTVPMRALLTARQFNLMEDAIRRSWVQLRIVRDFKIA